MAKPAKNTANTSTQPAVDTTTADEKVVAIKPRIHDVVPYQDGDTDVYVSKMAYAVLCQAETIRSDIAANGDRILAANPALTTVDILVVDTTSTHKWEQPISRLGDIGVKVNKPTTKLEPSTHNMEIYNRFIID